MFHSGTIKVIAGAGGTNGSDIGGNGGNASVMAGSASLNGKVLNVRRDTEGWGPSTDWTGTPR